MSLLAYALPSCQKLLGQIARSFNWRTGSVTGLRCCFRLQGHGKGVCCYTAAITLCAALLHRRQQTQASVMQCIQHKYSIP